MIKPVYVFSGFLDSGKTSVIKDTLYDPRFNQGERTLLIAMEEGDIPYDEKFLKYTHTRVVHLSLEELTHEKMKELDRDYVFEQVFIELNGLDDDRELYARGFIKNWELAQTLTVFDAELFPIQSANFKQFVYDHVVNAEVAIFNRSDNADRRFIRNNLKAINPRLEIIFEDRQGNVDKAVGEELFTEKELDIPDYDYGLWYMDALDNPLKYENRKITLKMTFLEDLPEYDTACIMGRRAMVCCAQDIAPIGLTCVGIRKQDLKKDHYYSVSGIIHCLDDEQGYKTCLLYVDHFQEAAKPENDLVSFN